MKYKIEKNTVQETLIIPLYARKVCSELYPNLYQDETAVRLIDEIDYDFSESEKKSRSLMQRFGSLEVAMRQNDLAFEVRDYLKGHPNAAVVNLGCGLDGTGRSCDNGSCKIYNLDFPDVIAVRNELLPAGEREENITCDLNNTEWFRKIDSSKGGHVSVRRQLSHAECEQLGNELRFQPAPQFFIHAEMGISVLVVKLTHRQTGYVPCIVFQNGVDRFHVTASSRFNDGQRQQTVILRLTCHLFSPPIRFFSSFRVLVLR